MFATVCLSNIKWRRNLSFQPKILFLHQKAENPVYFTFTNLNLDSNSLTILSQCWCWFFNCLRPITRMESPSNVWHLKWQTIYLEENKQNRQTGLHNFPLSLSCEICSGNICASFLSWIVIWNSVEGSELNCHNGIQSGWKGGVEPREGRVAKNKFCTGFNPCQIKCWFTLFFLA